MCTCCKKISVKFRYPSVNICSVDIPWGIIELVLWRTALQADTYVFGFIRAHLHFVPMYTGYSWQCLPGTRALCVASCPVKTRGKLSHHIGAPRRSGAWKALLLVTEGNALGPHVRPISICLEGSTPQDRTSPRNEICPTRPNPCFKRNGSVDIPWGIIEPVLRHRCPH